MQSAGLQCIYYEWRKCFLQLSLYFGLLELGFIVWRPQVSWEGKNLQPSVQVHTDLHSCDPLSADVTESVHALERSLLYDQDPPRIQARHLAQHLSREPEPAPPTLTTAQRSSEGRAESC